MVLEVDCRHPWLYMTHTKTFCKTQRKGLLLVLYSVIRFLFALYVNDLPQASNLTPTLFADDTLLTIACANSAKLQNGVNNELQKVDEWMRYNKSSLNYSKTTYILLNSNQSQCCNFNVKINDNKIKHTTCTKCLGVYIDQHLSWTNHIHNLEMKLYRSVAMLYRIRYYLSNMHWDQFSTV